VSQIKLSILILAIPERILSLRRIITNLEKQIADNNLDDKVEIVALLDNKKCSIAAKRNNLLQHAQGDYVAFLDDDDDISAEYVSSLVKASHAEKDVITFDQKCRINGKGLAVSFGLGNPHQGLKEGKDGNYLPILRPPYHVCAWKSSLAKSISFREVFTEEGQSCEDIDWCSRLYSKELTHIHVGKILHYYFYDSKLTTSIF